MWYFLCVVLGLGVGIGAGICFEKLGQYLYFKRISSGGTTPDLTANVVQMTELTNEIAGADIDTVFVGDSITEQYRIEDMYFGKNYVNRGLGCDTSGGVLARLNTTVFPLKPKKIIFMIGTNDLRGEMYRKDDQDLERIAENYKAIIELSKKALPAVEIYFESVYPVNANFHQERGRNNTRIDKLNIALKNICEQYSVSYLDTHPCLSDSNANLKKNFTGDGLHLNYAGYKVLTQFLKENIKGL